MAEEERDDKPRKKKKRAEVETKVTDETKVDAGEQPADESVDSLESVAAEFEAKASVDVKDDDGIEMEEVVVVRPKAPDEAQKKLAEKLTASIKREAETGAATLRENELRRQNQRFQEICGGYRKGFVAAMKNPLVLALIALVAVFALSTTGCQDKAVTGSVQAIETTPDGKGVMLKTENGVAAVTMPSGTRVQVTRDQQEALRLAQLEKERAAAVADSHKALLEIVRESHDNASLRASLAARKAEEEAARIAAEVRANAQAEADKRPSLTTASTRKKK